MLPVLSGSPPIGVLAIYKFKVDCNHLDNTQRSLLNRRRCMGRCGEQLFNKHFLVLKCRGGKGTYGGVAEAIDGRVKRLRKNQDAEAMSLSGGLTDWGASEGRGI